MYAFRTPSDFLPLSAHLPMKAAAASTWAYNNAGCVLLGLAIEQASGMPYTAYVEHHVLQVCGMASSGFFALDRLPGGTARGYLPTDDGGWRTNAYAVAIVGGADGGAFTTAHDLVALWDALLGQRLVGAATLERMLAPHWRIDGDELHDGYGVWIAQRAGRPDAYTMVGEDPGVFFRSRFVPGSGVLYVLFSNGVAGAHGMHAAIAPTFDLA